MSGCVFCKIVNRDIPSKIVYEDQDILVIEDARPVAPVHVLVMPKEHIPSITDVENYEIISKIFEIANRIAKELGISESGFRITNNCGAEGGQTISHLHFHLLGGRQLKDMV